MKCSIFVAALLISACQPAAQDNQAGNEAADETFADAGDVAGPIPPGTAPGSLPTTPPASDDDAPPPAGDDDAGPAPDPDPAPPPPAPVPADCPILGSRNWAAFINAMPGPNARPRLIVTGQVTTPTAGYRPVLRLGQIMQSQPVRVNVRLNPNPPSGGAAAVVTRHDVRGSWPMAPPVGAVTIRCGSKVLARINNVETAR